MRKYIILIITLCIFQISHGQNYHGAISLREIKLIEISDTLHINMEIEVMGDAISRTMGIKVMPLLSSQNTLLELPQVMVVGNNKYRSLTRSEKLDNKMELLNQAMIVKVTDHRDTVLSYCYNVPYDKWMDGSALVVDYEMIDWRNERRLISVVTHGEIEITTIPKPYEVTPQLSFVTPDVELKQRKREGQAYLDFPIGRSTIIPNYRRNPKELSKIKEAFGSIIDNPDVTIDGVFIEGYASPDGSYRLNERLSKERAYALRDYIVDNFSASISSSQAVVEWVAEDWEGVKLYVTETGLANSESILGLIDNTADRDLLEARLKLFNSGAEYYKMVRELFPELRRVEYQINYTLRDYTLNETRSLISKDATMLNEYELYVLAQDVGEKSSQYDEIILDIIPRLYPESETAMINAAARMVEKGEMMTALRYLERTPDNPHAINNMGVVYLLESQFDKAIELFTKASAGGVEQAEYNINETIKKQQDLEKNKR